MIVPGKPVTFIYIIWLLHLFEAEIEKAKLEGGGRNAESIDLLRSKVWFIWRKMEWIIGNKRSLTIIWVSVGSDHHEGGGQEQRCQSGNGVRRHASSSCSTRTRLLLENSKKEDDGKKNTPLFVQFSLPSPYMWQKNFFPSLPRVGSTTSETRKGGEALTKKEHTRIRLRIVETRISF